MASTTSRRGSPMTVALEPVTSSTSLPLSPWRAYAPALSNGCISSTYDLIELAVNSLNITRDSATPNRSPRSPTAVQPVRTECARPERLLSILLASLVSTGFPKGAPSRTTIVSAPNTTSPFSRGTERTLRCEIRSTASGTDSPSYMDSSASPTRTTCGKPALVSISERRGERDARTRRGSCIAGEMPSTRTQRYL